MKRQGTKRQKKMGVPKVFIQISNKVTGRQGKGACVCGQVTSWWQDGQCIGSNDLWRTNQVQRQGKSTWEWMTRTKEPDVPSGAKTNTKETRGGKWKGRGRPHSSRRAETPIDRASTHEGRRSGFFFGKDDLDDFDLDQYFIWLQLPALMRMRRYTSLIAN